MRRNFDIGFESGSGASSGVTPDLQEVCDVGNITLTQVIIGNALVSSGLAEKQTGIAGPITYNAAAEDFFIWGDTTLGNIVVNVNPAAAFAQGQIYALKLVSPLSGHTFVIVPTSGTIDGFPEIQLTVQNQCVIIQSLGAGTGFKIIANTNTSATPNLQAVTDVGNTTTDPIVTAGLAESVTLVATSPYTMEATDFTVAVIQANVSILLPDAPVLGKLYTFFNFNNTVGNVYNTKLIAPSGGHIENQANYVLNNNYQACVIVAWQNTTGNTYWKVLSYLPYDVNTNNSAINFNNIGTVTSYVVSVSDATIVSNTPSTGCTITIPAPVIANIPVGKTFTFKNSSGLASNILTITPAGATIDGAASVNVQGRTNNTTAITIQFDGANFWVISNYYGTD